MSDIISIILGFAIMIALMVGFVLLPYALIEWFIFKYKEGEYLRRLSSTIDGQIDASFWRILRNSAQVKGEWEGKKIEVKLYYRFRFRSQSPNLSIRFYHTFPHQISIWSKIPFSYVQFAPALYHRGEKISAGNSQFYQDYDIFSDSELNAKTFLTSKHMDIIQRLFTQRKIEYVDVCPSYIELYFQFDDFSGSKSFENILHSTEFSEVLIDIKRLTNELEGSK